MPDWQLRELKRIGTQQEDQQGLLTWTFRSSQRLNYQQKGEHCLDLVSGIYAAAVQFDLLGGPSITGVEAVSESATCL